MPEAVEVRTARACAGVLVAAMVLKLAPRTGGGGGRGRVMHAGGGEGDAEGGRRAGEVHGEPGELGDGDEGALRMEAREGLPHRPVQS
eukprot:scaffold56123_cov44-Phaeocystis_antarctica.AAC.1